MATRRLGKGLSALIPDIPEQATAQQKENLSEISVSRISPNPFQPRTEFEPEALEDLKRSIAEKGVITPITVRPFGNEYQLIAGERRLRAVQELGLDSVPAFVMRHITSDAEMLELALIENIQRENLNPIEEALAYQRLMKECNLTQEEVSKNVGKERATVANFLRLLNLPGQIKDSLARREISAGHARSILSCESEEDQIALWKKILSDGISVRQAEKIAKESRPGQSAKKRPEKDDVPYEVREIEDRLRQLYGTKVHIQLRKGAGSISMEFYSDGDFDRIVDILTKN